MVLKVSPWSFIVVQDLIRVLSQKSISVSKGPEEMFLAQVFALAWGPLIHSAYGLTVKGLQNILEFPQASAQGKPSVPAAF
jgi:hypothetical protein